MIHGNITLYFLKDHVCLLNDYQLKKVCKKKIYGAINKISAKNRKIDPQLNIVKIASKYSSV